MSPKRSPSPADADTADTVRVPAADRSGWRSAGRLVVAVVVVLVAVRVAACAFIVLSHQERVDGGIAGDVRRYVEMATAEGTPYQDFQVEYPPVTYGLIRLLASVDLGRSIVLVALSQLACDLGIAALLAWVWGRRALLAYLVLGLPLVLYPFVYLRIDLFATLLTVAGLALVRRRLDATGGGLLAVAVMAKLWPVAVAPVLLVERRVRGVVAFLAAGASLLAGWLLLAGTGGVQQVLSFRDATGWQVESLPGILWHLTHPTRVKFESGAFRTGVMPGWARPTLTLISLSVVAVAWWLAARRRRQGADDTVTFATAPLASVLALLLFAPILSPQYVVWMLPFAALAVARGDRLVGGLTLAVTALTTVSYPLVLSASEGQLPAIAPVLARNVLLVALLVVAVQSLAGVRRHQQTADTPAPTPTASPSLAAGASVVS